MRITIDGDDVLVQWTRLGRVVKQEHLRLDDIADVTLVESRTVRGQTVYQIAIGCRWRGDVLLSDAASEGQGA